MSEKIDSLRKLVKEKPTLFVVLAATAFIAFVVVASLYSNAVIYNLFTGSHGEAVGRGVHQSLTQTLVQYDGFQYTHIAEHGYTNLTYTAFFPLYPLITYFFAKITMLSVDYSALAVSWVSICAGAVVLFKWAKFELESRKYKVSPWVVVGLLLAFPTALFFVLPYS